MCVFFIGGRDCVAADEEHADVSSLQSIDCRHDVVMTVS